ncbi:MAG TPA: ABC transporter permease, partial [Steroidobacteraceae bacterium]
MIDLRAVPVAWRVLTLAQLREQPLRLLATVMAVALGVALGAAVYLINTAALTEFDQSSRRLIGAADLVIRGPPAGFDESLFSTLARDPSVSIASPLLELQLPLAPVAAQRAPLHVLGLDPFRAAALQPQLIAALSADITPLFAHDAIVLSRAAAETFGLRRYDQLPVIVGGAIRSLRVIDILPGDAYPEPLGIMDIAAAQWTLERLGRINRIDLRLRPGADPNAVRTRIATVLPAGVFAATAPIERGRTGNAARAYRVNLDMLALVALLAGAFLVFSTQWLSVLRRRVALGLLRSLGLTRLQLRLALLAESAACGLLGSLLGVLLGATIAALVLHSLGADLGNRQFSALDAGLTLRFLPMMGFVLLGTGAACAGGALPAAQAAQRAPAMALKAGDAEQDLIRLPTTTPGLVLVAAGAILAWLPPIGGLPWPGYLAIAALLIGAVLI